MDGQEPESIEALAKEAEEFLDFLGQDHQPERVQLLVQWERWRQRGRQRSSTTNTETHGTSSVNAQDPEFKAILKRLISWILIRTKLGIGRQRLFLGYARWLMTKANYNVREEFAPYLDPERLSQLDHLLKSELSPKEGFDDLAELKAIREKVSRYRPKFIEEELTDEEKRRWAKVFSILPTLRIPNINPLPKTDAPPTTPTPVAAGGTAAGGAAAGAAAGGAVAPGGAVVGAAAGGAVAPGGAVAGGAAGGAAAGGAVAPGGAVAGAAAGGAATGGAVAPGGAVAGAAAGGAVAPGGAAAAGTAAAGAVAGGTAAGGTAAGGTAAGGALGTKLLLVVKLLLVTGGIAGGIALLWPGGPGGGAATTDASTRLVEDTSSEGGSNRSGPSTLTGDRHLQPSDAAVFCSVKIDATRVGKIEGCEPKLSIRGKALQSVELRAGQSYKCSLVCRGGAGGPGDSKSVDLSCDSKNFILCESDNQ
jgi:hypothetical protein